jgi:hypothetical protein
MPKYAIFLLMQIAEKIRDLASGKLFEKYSSVLAVCPKEYLLFDHFFEQDEKNQISYTIGTPYTIFDFPLNITKGFLQEIYRNRNIPTPFNITRAAQLLQEIAKENELSMIYFSDEGESKFAGFTSILWSYHPGHKVSHAQIIELVNRIYFLMFGNNPQFKFLHDWIEKFEIGHIGTAFRLEKQILKIYLRLTYKDIGFVLSNINHNHSLDLNFLKGFEDGKTIFFLDIHEGNILRYGFEVRSDLVEYVLAHYEKFNIPINIYETLAKFQQICENKFPLLNLDEEQFRFHHLKVCFTTEESPKWKAYYAYNQES